jgi:pSer/pThr/pTyr-binding forkhead associated (FHA) protein
VLSRSHAEVWSDNGKVFIKDTKSSNGTYINEIRLSAGGVESPPHELRTGIGQPHRPFPHLYCPSSARPPPHPRASSTWISTALAAWRPGDVLKLGVDVLENNTAAHKCGAWCSVFGAPARD